MRRCEKVSDRHEIKRATDLTGRITSKNLTPCPPRNGAFVFAKFNFPSAGIMRPQKGCVPAGAPEILS